MEIDSKLLSWKEIEDSHDWKTLLLGNGASIALWKKFAYKSLYEEAKLTEGDQEIFDALETNDFEQVLRAIHIASLLCRQLGHSRGTEDRYESIRTALVNAVHRVHVPYSIITEEKLQGIAKELRKFKYVFSTNYDLVLYWALMSVDAEGFVDFFWSFGGTYFDSGNTELFSSRRGHTRMYYIHGALHLVEQSNRQVFKRTSDGRSLLEGFADLRQGSPLFVSEGSADKKLSAIRASGYLWYCYERLRRNSKPLVVFGSTLGEQDKHIVEAIRNTPARPIAISVYPASPKAVITAKIRMHELFPEASQVLFFDSTTHPLGASDMSVD